MLAAPIIDLPVPARSRWIRWAAIALSATLHLALALVWLGFPMPEPARETEPAITVELTAPPPPPTPAAEATKPAPAAEAKPIPQLEDGVLAKHSSPPTPRPGNAAQPTPNVEAPAPKPKKPAPVTQSERDFILSQVIRHWHPPRELAAYERADLQVGVIVDAGGYFDGDYDARRRWNPAGVFEGYDTLPPHSLQRRIVDAFYQAIRKAQPVRLPPELKAKAPFPVRLDFRFRDGR